jgi:hypothetical protein
MLRIFVAAILAAVAIEAPAGAQVAGTLPPVSATAYGAGAVRGPGPTSRT